MQNELNKIHDVLQGRLRYMDKLAQDMENASSKAAIMAKVTRNQSSVDEWRQYFEHEMSCKMELEFIKLTEEDEEFEYILDQMMAVQIMKKLDVVNHRRTLKDKITNMRKIGLHRRSYFLATKNSNEYNMTDFDNIVEYCALLKKRLKRYVSTYVEKIDVVAHAVCTKPSKLMHEVWKHPRVSEQVKKEAHSLWMELNSKTSIEDVDSWPAAGPESSSFGIEDVEDVLGLDISV